MTLQELKNRRLRSYLAAEEKILLNQSYTIGSRTFTRADLEEVRKAIQSLLDSGATLDDEIDSSSLNSGRVARVVFINS